MNGKVTGIGGIFFTAENPDKLKEWYKLHLGLTGIFLWNETGNERKAYTVWDVHQKATGIFKDYGKDYCWNYRVDDLGLLLKTLESSGTVQLEPMVTDEDGKFGFVKDPEGNKIILWEPSENIPESAPSDLSRVTGLGGLFFKSENTVELNNWYKTNLGFDISQWGCSFSWMDSQNPEAPVPAETAWSLFPATTDHFLPSQKQFMINYRVRDLKQLLADLKDENVTIIGEMEDSPYGKFGHILDPEQNKIELWQPA